MGRPGALLGGRGDELEFARDLVKFAVQCRFEQEQQFE